MEQRKNNIDIVGENTLILNADTVKAILKNWISTTILHEDVKIISVDKKYNDWEITFIGAHESEVDNEE